MSRIKNIRKSVGIKHMYVGLDLHKSTINATVMDENGTVLNEVKIKSADSLRNFSDSIPFGSDIAIALQHGTGHIGYYLKGTTLPYQTR
ncbi:MAG: hypothetical protein RXP28_07285 [Nitrososphaeria archaeon]